MSRNSLNNFDKRNKFDLSFPNKLTMDMGLLTPVLCKLALPGDKWRMSSDAVVRLMPMVAPIMHKVDVYLHTFSVPLRLLMDDWESFITGGKDNKDDTVLPYIDFADGVEPGTLADYLGVPTGVENTRFSALPFRAYNQIVNDWFLPENYKDVLGLAKTPGADTETNTTIQRRAWAKDYFTNALPWPQRGDPVFLPLGIDAPVVGNGPLAFQGTSGPVNSFWQNTNMQSGYVQPTEGVIAGFPKDTPVQVASSNSGLKADLSSATAITVDALRTAIQTQQWAYLAARAGFRYVEWLKAFFGVQSSDARLQRSEYLGGGRSPVMISEVLQTSSTDNTSPQGNMSGHGISAQRSHTFNKYFEEHCIVMTIASIMPKAGYMQGVYRPWLYENRYDFPNPIFSHLGEQGVYNAEIYYQANEDDKKIFGYSPRFQEMRYNQGEVHGLFRSDLDFWHLDRKFENLPTLNADFVECNPSKRIFAVPSEPGFLVFVNHNIRAVRALPKFGTPGLMDHY